LERCGSGWHLPEHRWVASATLGESEFEAVETLLKGPEHELPEGTSFLDKEGNRRRHARISWWEPSPRTLGEALLFQSHPEGLDLATPYDNPTHPSYPEHTRPDFFGHYRRSGAIEPERPNAVCLDYSIGKGDRLVAYRHDGGSVIRTDRFHVEPI